MAEWWLHSLRFTTEKWFHSHRFLRKVIANSLVFFPLFLSIMYSCYEVTYNKNLICTQSKSVGALRVNLWLSCILCYWFSIFRHLMQNYAGAQCMFRTYLDLKLKGGTKEHHCRGYGSDWDRAVYHPWYLMGLAKMSQCKSQNYSQDRKEKKH